jgi:hypothetical protein
MWLNFDICCQGKQGPHRLRSCKPLLAKADVRVEHNSYSHYDEDKPLVQANTHDGESN